MGDILWKHEIKKKNQLLSSFHPKTLIKHKKNEATFEMQLIY